MANRKLKLALYKVDPHCYWCGRKTILTNIQHIKGKPDPLMATVDHLIPKLDPRRWVEGEQRKVLACWECNNRRSHQDCVSFSKEEKMKRGTGFALNKAPNGKRILTKKLKNLSEVLDIWAQNGIVLSNEIEQRERATVVEQPGLSELSSAGSH